MKRIILAALVLFAFWAGATFFKAQAQKPTFSLPETAVQVAPNVFYLGRALDVDGRPVEGYAFVRRQDDQARPPKPPKAGGPTCYGFLAKGAKWKTIEPYLVDPANTRGLSESFAKDNLAANIATWEEAAAKNILGDETSGVVDGADTVAPDDKNEVYFADIADSNAIAVTIVWGYFSGPPQIRELVEWDQVYDDVTYDWSEDATGSTTKMDFWNIAIHELGHSVGLDDIYESTCFQVTMFGYAGFGETIKRTLEPADITGVSKLYQ